LAKQREKRLFYKISLDIVEECKQISYKFGIKRKIFFNTKNIHLNNKMLSLVLNWVKKAKTREKIP
jgi:hypothetical protein